MLCSDIFKQASPIAFIDVYEDGTKITLHACMRVCVCMQNTILMNTILMMKRFQYQTHGKDSRKVMGYD